MLIVAYRLSEGHASNLYILMTPGSIEVRMRLNDKALFTKLHGDIQSDYLALTRVCRSDTHMACILEGYLVDTLALCRIKKLHREWSIGVELKCTQTTLHIVEYVGIGHLDRTLKDAARNKLHALIIHVEASTTRVA